MMEWMEAQKSALFITNSYFAANIQLFLWKQKEFEENNISKVQNGNLLADDGNSNYKEILDKFSKMPT